MLPGERTFLVSEVIPVPLPRGKAGPPCSLSEAVPRAGLITSDAQPAYVAYRVSHHRSLGYGSDDAGSIQSTKAPKHQDLARAKAGPPSCRETGYEPASQAALPRKHGLYFFDWTSYARGNLRGAKLGLGVKSPFLDRFQVRHQWLQILLVLIDLNLYHGKR